MFIPQEAGDYKLILYNNYDSLESSIFRVIEKPLNLIFLEYFFGLCKS